MSQLSVIPNQCAAPTKKGAQCRNQARPGTSTCRLHTVADPVLLDSRLLKIALTAFLEASLKVVAEETIKFVTGCSHYCEDIAFGYHRRESQVYRRFYLEGLTARQATLPAPKEPHPLTAAPPAITETTSTAA